MEITRWTQLWFKTDYEERKELFCRYYHTVNIYKAFKNRKDKPFFQIKEKLINASQTIGLLAFSNSLS